MWNEWLFELSFVSPSQLDRATPSLHPDVMSQGLKNPTVQAYYTYMVNISVILGADEVRAKKELKEVLELEIEFAKVSNISRNLSFRKYLCKF